MVTLKSKSLKMHQKLCPRAVKSTNSMDGSFGKDSGFKQDARPRVKNDKTSVIFVYLNIDS